MNSYLTIAGFLFLLICIDQTCAQWTWQNPLPQGNTLYGVQFITPSTGWAVGACGSIIKTTDGGTTWACQRSGTRQALRALSFVDDTFGAVAGDSGMVLLTTDGGANWVRQPAITSMSLTSISFANVFTGYAAGSSGILIKTDDGGHTWKALNSGAATSLHGICASNTHTVTAVGDSGVVLRTTDGGGTWIQQASQWSYRLNGVVFTSTTNGLIIGDSGLVLRTNNGGANWTGKKYNWYTDLMCISMSDNAYGALLNADGSVMTTSDGGYTWQFRLYMSSKFPPLNSIASIDPTKLVLVGKYGSVALSSDSGKHWTGIPGSMSLDNVTDVSLPGPTYAYAVCISGEFLQSSDSGYNWRWSWIDNTVLLRGIAFPDSMNGYVSGSKMNARDVFRMFTSRDGGEFWTAGYTTSTLRNSDVASPGKNIATGVGFGGSIFSTDNGGTSWTERKWDPGYPVDLEAVCYADINTCFAVGTFGAIIKSTDRGIIWLAQSSGLSVPLYDVCFVNKRFGTAVGSTGVILATTNGGATWFRQESGTYYTLFGVSYADTLHGIAVGDSGTIISTEDGGKHWVLEESGTSNQLLRVAYAGSHYAIAVGHGGTILRRAANYTLPASAIPDDYILAPGKPNPFTSSTVITYGIPRDGLVRIDIYDILGRRVNVLLNETRQAGTYTIRFTPAGLSTGMYFCVMQSEGTTRTKRLVLMK
jgi:photosystem II stability/assembly factor-like uncharacterized protein